MKLFFIRNHSSSELVETTDEILSQPREKPSFPSKEEFRAWCHDRSTDHVFYCASEPETPSLRPSKENPVRWLHGVIVDYDAPKCAADIPNARYVEGKEATWTTVTNSGKARLIWAFERPIAVTAATQKKFLSLLEQEYGFFRVLPGADKPAYENISMVYELGVDWRRVSGASPIPYSVLLSLSLEAGKKADFAGDSIPLAAVASEVAKRWPGRWEGDFVEGAQGVRFWDPEADCPVGAWIRSGGVMAFTGEGRFLPWSEILGEDFVKVYKAERFRSAIESFYYDGRNYWELLARGGWAPRTEANVVRALAVDHGLKTTGPKGQPSEVTEVLRAIEKSRTVAGAFPFLFKKDPTVIFDNRMFLNISTAKIVPPAPAPVGWGDRWPWLAELLNQLFDEQSLEVFLSWLSRFYRGAHEGRVNKGHALFICGPASAGKTFLSHRVIGDLMGGAEEAASFILNKSRFSSPLFERGVWTVDDAEVVADAKSHDMYSQIVKKVVANFSLPYAKKFGLECLLPWLGRLIVTLNDDPVSIGMLPAADDNMIDKMIFLRARPTTISFVGAQEIVARELPYFAAYLLQYEVPERLKSDAKQTARFGFAAWHDPALLAETRLSSPAASLVEIIAIWWREWHKDVNKPTFSGTSLDLYNDMLQSDAVSTILNKTVSSDNVFGKRMKKIVLELKPSWICMRMLGGRWIYEISNPDPE